ncbi:type 4 pilus major pilin [Yersinia enterocolitica]|nr:MULTISPECIES: type 4 pilus major pilin [Yersinia]HDL7635102.1 prepilin [Yersinia enterocolitica]CNI92884.1 type IV pilus biogenesis protein [Yersinia intermedia]HDY4940545.1 prepilin [Yersinia enterocolitica]HEA9924623.1 prepilin [Yersinia enterocolitica]HEI6730702.1 prepilin [Yersinia enterocolitica]
MELTRIPIRSTINKGAITLFEAAIYLVIALVVLAVAMTQGGGLFNRNDASTEFANAGELVNSTRSMMKTAGTYNFASADAMTGALVQFGGATSTSLTVVGDKASGSAKLQNTWGGAVTVEPVSSSGGQKSSFSLTYAAVPQEACITLATKLSAVPSIVTTKVNGTTNTGQIAASSIGAQCTADNGSVGQNTLIFTSNT